MSQTKSKLQLHLDEVYASIKLIDVEERFDIYFSRFFGLFFAKLARFFSLTPTHVSLLSLVVGMTGGGLLYFQNDMQIVILGSFLIVVAGVLDSADGQLARMTEQSSDIGRAIDGIIDNFVFVACYVGGAAFFYDTYGFWVFVLASASGYAHSFKAALYEFYKSEYIHLVAKSKIGYIPLSAKELSPTGTKWYHNFIHVLYKDYTSKQLLYTTRSQESRSNMMNLAFAEGTSSKFAKNYVSLNKSLLTYWALISGTNTHRTAIIFFALLGRFDLYLWSSLVWTFAVIPMNLIQRRRDRKLLLEMQH